MSEGDVLSEPDFYLSQLSQSYQEGKEVSTLGTKKEEAWQAFLKMGLPTKAISEFRPLKLRALFSKELRKAPKSSLTLEKVRSFYPKEANAILVFVNGVFHPELSETSLLPKKLVILPFKEALSTFSTLFASQWSRKIAEEQDPFTLLNNALFANGLFLYAPPKMILEEPLAILHLIDTTEPSLVVPKVQLYVGAQAKLKLICRTLAIQDTSFTNNSSFDIHLEEGARVHHVWDSSQLPAQAIHLESVRGYLKENSSLKGISLSRGSETSRQDLRVQLAGQNAEAHLSGLWVLKDKREAHTHVLMEHLAPNCHSMQLYKGILHEAGRSSFDGRIVVQQAAQKTEAYQLNHNLVLSERARAETKPNLKIFADDVKASHGATIGQLDEEQLFYLLTRGLSRKVSKQLLTQGFCQEIIDLLPYPALQEEVRQWQV